MYELSLWVHYNGDDTALCQLLRGYIAASGHTILDTAEHAFTPQGFTCMWLLAESHMAVHTYPEHSRAYIQLSSCSLSKYQDLSRLLRDNTAYINWQASKNIVD